MSYAEPVLLFSSVSELNSIALESELRAMGADPLRLNADGFSGGRVGIRLTRSGWMLEDHESGRRVRSDQLRCAWTRGGGTVDPDLRGIQESARRFGLSEWQRTFDAIFATHRMHWINHPHHIRHAGNRLVQMTLASRYGLRVPRWVVGACRGSLPAAVAFPGPYITKAINSGGAWECGSHSSHTLAIDDPAELAPDAELLPTLVQRRIVVKTIVRAYVVGNVVVAASAEMPDAETVDSRCTPDHSMYYAPYRLPTSVRSRLLRLAEALGLVYGAADIAVDASNRYWFLEVNPSGQWGWIEGETYLQITRMIAANLVHAAKRP